ncbi:MAG: AAA family ATPase [Holophagaceae bacterium]|nr:AAA family ATPase [Holophagaceae bacterium]
MKKIVILVGPKGAGKSTIGQLLATELGLHFLRVEPLFLRVRAELGASHPDFEPRGLASVLASVKEALSLHEAVCIESTGASTHLPGFLDEASGLGQVLLVRVLARPDQCLERIRTRDTSIHIPVSDDQIQRINALAAQVDLPWAAQLDNRGAFDPPGICRTISALLADRQAPSSPV